MWGRTKNSMRWTSEARIQKPSTPATVHVWNMSPRQQTGDEFSA